jgi:dihydrofolate synthase/folylpolyglutamate synthase
MSQVQPALEWLLAFSDPQRGVGWNRASRGGLEANLRRTRVLLDLAGAPDRRMIVVLVAGTKGKGSTCALLASILQAHRLRVGLYTQPHLHTIRERLRVNGVLIDERELANLLTSVKPVVKSFEEARPDLGRLTSYEVLTVATLAWFADRGVEWAVLEVGLGGRLDATNIVRPDVAVITPISFDHMHVLGRTLRKIASEKGGIIKPDGLVVSAPQPASAGKVLEAIAARQQAELIALQRSDLRAMASYVPLALDAESTRLRQQPFFEVELSTRRGRVPEVPLPLGGAHQVTNLVTAVRTLEALDGRLLELDPEAVRAGVARTRWPGRFEVGAVDPLTILDGAHNGASARALREAIDLHVRHGGLQLVLGVMADKDLPAILRPFGDVRRLTAVSVEQPRARPVDEILTAARRVGIEARGAESVREGLAAARAEARSGDLVAVTGSLAVVAEACRALGLEGL